MKNKSVLLISIIAIAIGAVVGYAFGSGVFESASGPTGEYNLLGGRNTHNMGNMHMMPDGTMMGNDGPTMGMMDHSAMMVQSEQEFIEGMIPHHQEAIDTAKEVLERGGTTPEVRTLAESIVTAQEQEIVSMKEWYEDWYGEPYVGSGDYVLMMRDLSQLKGVELDRTFLGDMIMHHMGAIMMAQSVQPYVEHTEISGLTKAIVETQSAEIQTMRNLLRDLE